jgi:hypothetical protein
MTACVLALGTACGPASGDDGSTSGDDGSTSGGTLDASGAPEDGSDTAVGGSDETGSPACAIDTPDLSTPPSSTRDGRVVSSVGPGPRFEVPASWIDWYDEYGNNLHLSRPEIDAVEMGGGEWDTEYDYVLDALLPHDRCAAHAGGEGWAVEAVSFGDLQLRVYVVEATPEAIVASIDEVQWDLVVPEVSVTEDGPWTRAVLNYELFFGDYGGPANVDLRMHRFGDATVVMAGMYSDAFDAVDELEAIMATVCWASPSTGECCSPDGA